MTNRNARYRAKRIAAGAKPVFLLLSQEAASELDARCAGAAMSRVQLIEKWLSEKSTSTEK